MKTTAERNRMVIENMPLLHAWLRKHKPVGMDYDDAVQEAALILVDVVEAFDPAMGTMSTYLYAALGWKLQRARSERYATIRLPINLARKVRKLWALRAAGVTNDQMVAQAAFGPTTIERIESVPGDTLSLDAALTDEGDFSGADTLIDHEPLADDALSAFEQGEVAKRAVEGLRKKERDIIDKRFGITGPEMTLAEIGDQHGVSRERIRQLETIALGKLKKALRGSM